MRAILVLPAHNEREHIAQVVADAKPYVDRVIVVNDGSLDDTAQRAQEAGAQVISHAKNLGKAEALKTGCEAAFLLQPDILVLMDSDGQHEPKDIPRVIAPIIKDEADIVVASRKGGQRMPFVRYFGNRLLELAIRTLFRVHITDIQSGFRAFRTSVYPKLRWVAKNYHADAEMTARIGKFRLRYREVFIPTIYHHPTKGMGAWDGIQLLWNIVRWRFTI